MKRSMLAILLIIGMLVASCAPATVTQAPASAGLATEEPAAVDQVEVIWYVRADADEQEWERSIIPAFEAEHPNIKINLVIVPWNDFDTKMQTMIAAGTPPDIWSHWGPSGYGDYVRRNLVADLAPFIEREDYDLSDFSPGVIDVFRVGDQILGLPVLFTGSYVYYNKDLLDAAGVEYPPTDWDDTSWTWDAFVDKCAQLTNNTGDPETTVFGCHLESLYYQYPWLWGQPTYPDEASQSGFSDEAYLDSPGWITSLQARQDLAWELGYMPDPAQVDAMGGDEIFPSGKVAMLLAGGSDWWQFGSMKLHEKFNWGVAALPYADPGRKAVTYADPWMMSSKTAHPDEAWEFMKYLASPAVMQSWSAMTGCPPVRLSLLESWYKQFPTMSPEEVEEVFSGSLRYGVESYNNLLVRADRINQVISAALDPINNNVAKAADVLPDADKQLEDTLRQIKAEYAE